MVGSPTSAAKEMTSRSEPRSFCIETLKKFPEPQAGSSTRPLAISSTKRLRRSLRAESAIVFLKTEQFTEGMAETESEERHRR
jgi:hypothetical protein